MPQELQNLLVTLNIIFVFMFIVVTVIIVMAYLYETKKSREYKQLIKQLVNDGRYDDWEEENKILILIEKCSLGAWFLTLMLAAVINIMFTTDSQTLLTTPRTIFGTILVVLTFTNIFTKRLLRKNIIDATTDVNQQGK